jgi:hypothetical protein
LLIRGILLFELYLLQELFLQLLDPTPSSGFSGDGCPPTSTNVKLSWLLWGLCGYECSNLLYILEQCSGSFC